MRLSVVIVQLGAALHEQSHISFFLRRIGLLVVHPISTESSPGPQQFQLGGRALSAVAPVLGVLLLLVDLSRLATGVVSMSRQTQRPHQSLGRLGRRTRPARRIAFDGFASFLQFLVESFVRHVTGL